MKEKIDRLKSQLLSWGKYVYHKTYLDGIVYPSIRNCEDRLKVMYFDPHCNILDMGCNIGGMLWPLRFYYNGAIGIDRDDSVLNLILNLRKFIMSAAEQNSLKWI